MKRCLHIFLSDIAPFQSRLYKEATFVLGSGILDEVFVLGLWSPGSLTKETDKTGLQIFRKPTLVRRFKNLYLFKRVIFFKKILAALSLIEYAFSCIMSSRRLQVDHVSCHNAAMLPVAWAASRFAGATLEYLPHELETQRSGLSGVAKRITCLIERHFVRSARNVVVVCDPIRKWYEEAYGLSNVLVVRNVPERDAVQIHPIGVCGFRQHFNIPDSAIVFIYQGLFSAGRGIEALLDTFAAVDPQRCHLVLMGYGEEHHQNLINEASRQHSNIHFQPAVARESIISYSASADVGIFISERATLSYRYAMPNKFFEWAHAGLPILVSDNLEYQAELLREEGFGWATPLEGLLETVQRVSETNLSTYSEKARLYAVGAVWEEDAKAFAKVYRDRES